MYTKISSLQNSLIKEILVLQDKSRARKKSGLFIIEGKREILLALRRGYTLEKIGLIDKKQAVFISNCSLYKLVF